ncbi:MAG: 23S rRNA (pseudouridine(1915)-N(3))-methyltransferase RlmH [Devosia sp.]
MKAQILAIGRMKDGPERVLVERYLERARATGRALGLGDFSVHEAPESRAGSAPQRKAEEAQSLRRFRPENGVLVVLDEHGEAIGSEALARRIASWRDAGRPGLAFVIGGADGLDPALMAEAEMKLSFSPLTWPHQLVRIMLAEQLYRTTTILSGHPYHRA